MADEFEQQLARLQQGDHACQFWDKPGEHALALAAFKKQGQERCERSLSIVPESGASEPLPALPAVHRDALEELERGSFKVVAYADLDRLMKDLDPARLTDLLAREVESAQADGFSGLRVTGLLAWASSRTMDIERMADFEAVLNDWIRGQPLTVLCQCERSRVGAACIHELLRTHSVAILGSKVCSNPYCESAELVRNVKGPAEDRLVQRRVQEWIAHLERAHAGEQEHAQMEQALRAMEEDVRWQLQELEQIYRDAPVGLGFLSPKLRFVRLNDQLAAMNGMSVGAHLGRTIREILPEMAEQIEPILQRVIATGEPLLNVPLRGVTRADPNMERAWLACYSPLKPNGAAVAGLTVAVVEISELRRAEARLQDYAERLQALSRRLLDVQETERRHLARELHDEVGQLLTGLRLLLRLPDEAIPLAVRQQIEQARSIVDTLLQQVRGLSFDLRPAALDQLGLIPALLGLFDRFREQARIQVDFRHDGSDAPLPAVVQTTAYRIIQEALTNVVRHAGVDTATVRVWVSAAAANDHGPSAEQELPEQCFNIQIEDTGRGFDSEERRVDSDTGGLLGMEERVMLLNGILAVESSFGKGTVVSVELPLTATAVGPPASNEEEKLDHGRGI